MKTLIKIAVIMLFFSTAQSQDGETAAIHDIISNIKKYQKKTVTLKLKLKTVDNIFGKIIFYDKKNNDIEFDISTKAMREKLKLDILNLHEGLDYYVTFMVKDVGNLGGLIGELLSFKPVVLNKIP